jgi:hypothetical protein
MLFKKIIGIYSRNHKKPVGKMATEAGGIYSYQRTLLIRFKDQFPLHRRCIAGQTPNILLSLGTSNAFRVMNS